MKEVFSSLKNLCAGEWRGEGFASYPTITDTGYTEILIFEPDAHKDAIFFNQHTFYNNNQDTSGQTVFRDTGFVILKEDRILLISVQIGGRMEMYGLTAAAGNQFIFEQQFITGDASTVRAQRVFMFSQNALRYELNMATTDSAFRNHLIANLQKITR